MALIEVFHLVASDLPIDATTGDDIPQGSVVVMDPTTGGVVTHVATTAQDAFTPVGFAADSKSNGTTSYTPESGAALNTHWDSNNDGALEDAFDKTTWPNHGFLVTGAWGTAERSTQNRVSDNYNEVIASGKMTVYHSGGEIWTDQYVISDNAVVQTYDNGTPVFMCATAGLAGKVTAQSPGIANAGEVFAYFKNRVGICLRGNTDYPSGVPGTETDFLHLNEGGNSMSYGQFVHLKLLV
jgi:hypothetical protein